jgi:hypothetical protein
MGNFITTANPGNPLVGQSFQLVITDEMNLVDTNKSYELIFNGISFTNYTITLPNQITFNNVISYTHGTKSYSLFESSELVYTSSLYIQSTEPGICFNKGTKILCYSKETENRIYIPIEKLKSGDLVVSYLHGILPIRNIAHSTMINNPIIDDECMYRMRKNENMIDDLIVTPYHSILVDEMSRKERRLMKRTKTINDKKMVYAKYSDQFEKVRDNNKYTYYHFSLDGPNKQYGIWANGVLTESCPDKSIKKHM